jgi:hypothetical protein
MGKCINCKYDDISPYKEPCNNCIKHNKFEKIGGEKMEKKVDFADAIKAFDEGKTIVCKKGTTICNTYKKSDNRALLKDQHNMSITASEIIHGDWYIEEPVEQVPFMTAMKAFDKGKTVMCKVNGYEMAYDPDKCNGSDAVGKALRDRFGNTISIREVLDGKWFIKK